MPLGWAVLSPCGHGNLLCQVTGQQLLQADREWLLWRDSGSFPLQDTKGVTELIAVPGPFGKGLTAIVGDDPRTAQTKQQNNKESIDHHLVREITAATWRDS